MNLVAIDPGKSGSVIHLHNKVINVYAMPQTRCEALGVFNQIREVSSKTCGWDPKVYIEKVVPFCPGGGAAHMFTYGRAVEMITCVPFVLGFDVIEVPPQTWQKELGLGNSNRVKVPGPPRLSIPKDAPSTLRRQLRKQHKLIVSEFRANNMEAIKEAEKFNQSAKREWKGRLRDIAQQAFPNFKVTLENCDGLLILAYAKKVNELI